MTGLGRKDIKSGLKVYMVWKKDQRTEKMTKGIVKDVLACSSTHPHGIKVKLEEWGRVKGIIKLKSALVILY